MILARNRGIVLVLWYKIILVIRDTFFLGERFEQIYETSLIICIKWLVA